MAESKASINNMVIAILGLGNSEQNAVYPPNIISAHYNAATSFLLSKGAKIYPDDESTLDILDPYVKKKVEQVKGGYVTLPDDYRNLLGSPMIVTKENGCAECDTETETVSNGQFEQLVLKSGCQKTSLVIVPQSEFSELTSSTYMYPTVNNPVGYFSGSKQIKVCPPNIKAVEFLYLKQEEIYNYGYTMQPDDTFVFDKNTTKDGLWTSAAFEPMFRLMFAMYTAYTRDNQLRDWAMFIEQNGGL
jgi:hypothetical protein